MKAVEASQNFSSRALGSKTRVRNGFSFSINSIAINEVLDLIMKPSWKGAIFK
jgi:hypothetical protein